MWTSRDPGSTVRTRLAIACLAGVLMTGCQDAEPGRTSGEPASEPTSASPSETPEVEPADGPIVRGDHASYRVPSNFEVSGELAGTFPAGEKGTGRGIITLGELPNLGNTDLDYIAKALARSVARDRGLPKPVAQTTLAGEPAFHVEGQVQPGQHFTAYGAVHEGQIVYVRFDLDGSRAQNADLIESVLATWQWK